MIMGHNGNRWNGDMEGKKGSTEEGGTRSPLLIRWPKGIKPGTKVKQIASVLDLLPTLTEMAGVSEQPKKKLDGRSLFTFLNGEPRKWTPRILISSWKSKVGARDQRFRLDYKGRLYDMDNDPGQRTEVSKKFPKIYKNLIQEVNKYKEEVLVELGTDERPFVIGHPDVSWTQIPARDGVPTGEIKRSNKFPNCSYFLNWKNEEDYISWDVEVGKSGFMKLSCGMPVQNEMLVQNSKLSFLNQSLISKITREVNPPLLTGYDRKVRTEGYVKYFESMKMGKIKLAKGKGELKLQATKIPGDQALEFRLLMLNRISK